MARDTSGSRLSVAQLLNTPEGVQWRRVLHSEARLESTRRSSIILAAFCFATFSSLQVNMPSGVPIWIAFVLSLNSGLLVVLHSFAFLVSTFLLPKLQAVAKEYQPPKDGDFSMKPVPFYSPHDKFRGFVELSYNISHILGLFLFLIEIVLVAWVKFWDLSYIACLASTIIMIPFIILFILFLWYKNYIINEHVYKTRSDLLENAEREFICSEEILVNASDTSTPSTVSPRHYNDYSLNPDACFDNTVNFETKSPIVVKKSTLNMNDPNRLGYVNKNFVSE